MIESRVESLFSLTGKVALITGATHGIGFAIATIYAQAGAVICFNGRREETNQKALEEYAKLGIQAYSYVCDVNKEEEVQAMVRSILKQFGKIDILVNNAGIIERTPFLETSADSFQSVVETDLVAPFIVAKAVLPSMVEQGSGKIINICSMLSELGRANVASYSAAKGGLKMLTKSICAEFAQYNIQCNGLGPGYIATSQTAPLREKVEGKANPFDTFIKKRTPAQRWGEVDDLKGPALFLASAASDFVNGQILYVDGGLLAFLGRQ